jgi:hypothetical protein
LARLFYASVLAGIVLVLILAGIFPLPHHERYRSSISVIPDGGRAESFVIQWPQDRVELGAGAGLLGGRGVIVMVENGAVAASAEVFRLRDLTGNVIGLASRSTSQRAGASGATVQGSDWILLLPSRGALFMTQTNRRDMSPRLRAADGGLIPPPDAAGFWADGNRLPVTSGPAPGGAGRVTGGTEEFAGLQGAYDEVWDLEEIGAGGETRGRITLTTRLAAVR